MTRELYNRGFSAHPLTDVNDPPRWAQPVEATKVALVETLREYLSAALTSDDRRFEIPTVDKYATSSRDAYETVATVLRKHPDVLERAPHVAVMTATGSEERYLGTPFMALVQDAPRIVATIAGPYALADDDQLVLRTEPKGVGRTSTLVLKSNRFEAPDTIGAATTTGLAGVINEIGLYVLADTEELGLGTALRLKAGGPRGGSTPNAIEVLPGTSTSILTALGIGRRGTGTAIGGTTPDMTLTSAAATWTAADVGRYLNISYDLITRATASSVATNVVTYTVPTGHGFTAGMRITTEGFQVDISSPVAITSVTATTIVLPLVTGNGSIGTGKITGYSSLGHYNGGRFLITAVNGAGSIVTFTNESGRTEAAFAGQWFIGLRDDWKNPLRPPKFRYNMSMNLDVQIQVVCQEENGRAELTDLLLSFFQMYMDERSFTWYGHHGFDDDASPLESYTISLRGAVQLGGEDEVERPNDSVDKAYLNTLQIPLLVEMHIDREAYAPGTTTPWIVDTFELDDTLATPD